MGLLEVAVMFENSILVEDKFYEYDKAVVLDAEIRDQMLSAVVGLSTNAFGDEIQNFAVNDFVIVFQNTSFHSLHDPEQECKIRIYGIATKDTTNLKLLSAALNDALFQFVNRYSRIDIQNKNLDKFAEFKSRFEKIFRDFIVKEKKEDILKTAKKMRMQEQARERNIEQHRYSMGNTRFT